MVSCLGSEHFDIMVRDHFNTWARDNFDTLIRDFDALANGNIVSTSHDFGSSRSKITIELIADH